MPPSSGLVQIPRRLVQNSAITRRFKVLFFACLITCGFSFLMMIIAVSSASRAAGSAASTKKAKPVAPPDNYQALAYQAVISYLTSQPIPLPLATGVPVNLGRQAIGQGITANANAQPLNFSGLTFQNSQFFGVPGSPGYHIQDRYLTTIGGRLYLITVPIELSASGNPVIANVPTLEPFLPGLVAGTGKLDYSSVGQVPLTDGAKSQLATWAQAWAGNNQQQLYQLTGDQQQRQYAGLGGWVLAQNPQVVSVTPSGPNQIVQYLLSMAPTVATGATITTVYDLLLTNTNHPIPNIAAWGPAGSGPTLQPFQNAQNGLATITTTTIPTLTP